MRAPVCDSGGFRNERWALCFHKSPHLVIKISSDDHYGRRDQVRPGESRGGVPNSPRGRSTVRPGARRPRGCPREQTGARGSRAQLTEPNTAALGASACHFRLLGCAHPCVWRTHNTHVPCATLVDTESQFSQTHFPAWSDPQDFSSPSWPMLPVRLGKRAAGVPMVPPRLRIPVPC